MTKKDVSAYAPVSKWLHWIIALLVLPMLLFGFFLDDMPQAYKGTVFMIHKSCGLTVLLLMIMRLIVIVSLGKPPLPATMPRWEVRLSHIVQHSFYLGLILMPLCGWVMSTAADRAPVYFNWLRVPFPGVMPDKALSDFMFLCHQTLAWILIGLIFLHIAGALKHYFINKDKVLQRMLSQ